VHAQDVLAVERFLTHVDTDGPIAKNKPDLGRCWLWTGGTTPDGYGVFHYHKSVRAHRWLYQQVFGPVPDGLVLDHFACDTPRCVRPTHMRPVTTRENVLRGDSASSLAAAATHCPSGHDYTTDGYVWRGIRYCRPCRTLRMRAWRNRRKATSA
jgi:hypothetical protein